MWGELFDMYERFYNLRERPFSLSPDPEYLYPSRVHRETLSHLRYGIEGHAGFVVITGEIGSGKTTLLQTVLKGLDRQTSVARLVNTNLDTRELIESVLLDFGIEFAPGVSKPHLLRDLARYLVEQRSAGRLALLVIDEAQNLSLAALEEVRMLSNLETEKSKLIQIVLVGQPNLRDVLGRPELEQLRQRVTVSYHMHGLDTPETHAYVNHRLRRASLGAPLEFSRPVTDLIHKFSRGIPRTINVISDATLLFGYGEERKTIDVGLVTEVIDELMASGLLGPVAAEPPPDARVMTPAEADRDLAVREARIAQRERELVEQRRVLAEEHRLMRVQREMSAAAERRSPAPVWPPIAAPAPAAAARPVGTPPPAAAAAAPTAASPLASPDGATTRPAASIDPIMRQPVPAGPPPRPAAPRPLSPPVRPVVGTQIRDRYYHATPAPPPGGFWRRLRQSVINMTKPVLEE
jgi:putative secretion ATPase (PEP-CTERM system associated)